MHHWTPGPKKETRDVGMAEAVAGAATTGRGADGRAGVSGGAVSAAAAAFLIDAPY